MHHLDNAATSWPKPAPVVDATARALGGGAGNPGRGSGSAARRASGLLEDARRRTADFLGARLPERLVFTLNATDALNLAIKGLVPRGGRVVATRLEHSAVMRPLRGLASREALELELVTPRPCGRVAPEDLAAAAPGADLVVLTCASNVTGVVQPWEEADERLGELGVPLLLDAAQAAGHLPLDAGRLGPRTALALTGHKGLAGPMGCGALLLGEELEPRPWREGGTGDGASLLQPEELPARLEAGTPPLPAIAGLAAAIDWWQEQGPERLRGAERELGDRLLAGLEEQAGVRLPGRGAKEAARVPLVTFLIDGYRPGEAAALLESEFSVTVRAGLHCARDAHELLGTFPEGALRASIGPTTRAADVEALLRGVAELAAG